LPKVFIAFHSNLHSNPELLECIAILLSSAFAISFSSTNAIGTLGSIFFITLW